MSSQKPKPTLTAAIKPKKIATLLLGAKIPPQPITAKTTGITCCLIRSRSFFSIVEKPPIRRRFNKHTRTVPNSEETADSGNQAKTVVTAVAQPATAGRLHRSLEAICLHDDLFSSRPSCRESYDIHHTFLCASAATSGGCRYIRGIS